MADTVYVRMPQADYVAIADATRSKTGTSAALKSGDIPTAILGIPSGGGNPNSIETIAGTLANPFGNYSVSDIKSGLSDNSITVKLTLTIGNTTATVVGSILGYLRFCAAIYNGEDWQTVVEVSYYDNGNLYNAIYDQSGTKTDLEPMATRIVTTLTIIHHPIPDDP